MFLVSSAFCMPCLTARRQARWSSAQLSHVLILMLHSFMSFLQTSLKRRPVRPVSREPSASPPYRRSLGMRPGSILLTWPSQRRRLSLRMANMLFMLASKKDSALKTLTDFDCEPTHFCGGSKMLTKTYNKEVCRASYSFALINYGTIVCGIGSGSRACLLQTAVIVFL